MYDQLGGGFHRYSVDERWLVPHFEKMLYDNALLAAAYLHALARHRRRALPRGRRARRSSTCCASCCCRRAASPRRRTPTPTASRGSPSRGPRRRALPAELLEPFEHGRSIIRGELDEETRARLLELREQRPKPLRDDKAIASWNGLALAALAEAARRLERAGLARGRARPRRVPARPALRRRTAGCAGACRDGRTSGPGYPRRLRERRARPARAARRDRRAALARGGEPAGAARGRALRRRRARRLLPLAGRRRAARRADEGARRPPAPVGQRDARARAAPARPDLRRRRARAARRLRAAARAARARAGAAPPSAGRSARSTCT